MSAQQVQVMEQSILQMQNALVVAMEEVESVRKEMLLENGKLQREFRETVDTIVQHSQDTVQTSVSTRKSHAANETLVADQKSRIEFLEIAVRTLQENNHQQKQQLMGLSANQASAASSTKQTESTQRLEQTVNALRQQHTDDQRLSDDRFKALENRILEMQSSLASRTDERLQALEKAMIAAEDRSSSQLRSITSDFKQQYADIQREVREQRATLQDLAPTVKAHASELASLSSKPSMSRAEVQQLVDHSSSSSNRQLSSAREDLDRAREALSSLQQATSLNERKLTVLEESSSHQEAELTSLRSDLTSVQQQANKTTRQADALEAKNNEFMAQHLSPARSHNRSTAGSPAAGGGAGAGFPAGSAASVERGAELLRQMEAFVEDFTMHESSNIRDEVMRLLQSESVVTQRRVDDKRSRDEQELMKQDIIRCLTQVERMTEDVNRLTQQQHSLYQAFQRAEQSTASFNFRVEQQLKDELTRNAEGQKAFVSRQEALLQDERHQLALHITNELSKAHAKETEDFHRAETRRQKEATTAQETLREDFTRFTNLQQERMETGLQKVKEEMTRHVTKATDDAARTQANHTENYKRQQSVLAEDTKKSLHTVMDELKRVKAMTEETSNRLVQETNFLNSKIQKSVDDELRRVDRVMQDGQLRLDAQVEETVSRVVATTEGSIQRSLNAQTEHHGNELNLLREEIRACRQTMDTLTAPSNSVVAIDNRVDVLRKDVDDMQITYEKVRDLERKLNASMRSELKVSTDVVRSEVLRDVGVQLQRFDQTVADIRREQNRANEIVDHVERKLESATPPPQQIQQQPAAAESIVLDTPRVSGPTFPAARELRSGSGGAATAAVTPSRFRQPKLQPQQPHFAAADASRNPASGGSSVRPTSTAALHLTSPDYGSNPASHAGSPGGNDLLLGAFATNFSP